MREFLIQLAVLAVGACLVTAAYILLTPCPQCGP